MKYSTRKTLQRLRLEPRTLERQHPSLRSRPNQGKGGEARKSERKKGDWGEELSLPLPSPLPFVALPPLPSYARYAGHQHIQMKAISSSNHLQCIPVNIA